MTQPLNLSGAVDLSTLKRAQQEDPNEVFECTVDGGCNMTVRGKRHETPSDCVTTLAPYVYMYAEAADQLQTLAVGVRRIEDMYNQACDIAEGYKAEKDRLAGELRDLRRETGRAEEAVLDGADDLATSMKANFGTKQPEPTQAPATVDNFKAAQYAAVRKRLVEEFGASQELVNSVSDENLGDLFMRVKNGELK